MPNTIGGPNPYSNVNNPNLIPANNTDIGTTGGVGNTANIQPTVNETPATSPDRFEVANRTNTNEAGGVSTLFNDATYLGLRERASTLKTKGNTNVGVYRTESGINNFGMANRNMSSGVTDWANRIDLKYKSPDPFGPQVSSGPQRKESQADVATLFSGMTGVDHKLGVQAGASGSIEGGLGSASGSARVYSEVGARALAGLNVTSTGVVASAGAEAKVVAAGAEVKGKISTQSLQYAGQNINLNADVFGSARIEASANIGAEIGIDRDPPKAVLSGKVGAFAGAKAQGQARFGIGDIIKVGVYGEGWAGAGAEASANVGYNDGKFSLGASAGAGLGLGGKVGVRVDVDVVKAAAIAKEAADFDKDGRLTLNDPATAITKTADAAMTGIERTVDKTLNALDANGDGRFSRHDVGLHAARLQKSLHNSFDVNNDGKLGLDDVGAAARNVGQAGLRGAQTVGNAIASGAKIAGDAIASGARFAGETISNTARATGRAAFNLADVNNDGKLGLDDVGTAARNVGQATMHGAQAVANASVRAGQAIADGAIATGQAIADGARATGRAAFNLADVNNDGKLGLNDVSTAARNVGQATVRGAQAAANSAVKAGQAIADGARATGRAAFNLADVNNDGKLGLNDVGTAARNVGQATVRGVQTAANATVKAGQAVANTSVKVGRAVADTSVKVGREIGQQATQAAQTLADGASRTYRRAEAVVGRVANFFGW
jgi:Ca2+-binding EF-hand superfamily protein